MPPREPHPLAYHCPHCGEAHLAERCPWEALRDLEQSCRRLERELARSRAVARALRAVLAGRAAATPN